MSLSFALNRFPVLVKSSRMQAWKWLYILTGHITLICCPKETSWNVRIIDLSLMQKNKQKKRFPLKCFNVKLMLHSLAMSPWIKPANHFIPYFASLAVVQTLTSSIWKKENNEKKRHLGSLQQSTRFCPWDLEEPRLLCMSSNLNFKCRGRRTGNNATVLNLHKVLQPSVLNGLISRFLFFSFFILDSETVHMQSGAVRGRSESILTQGLSRSRRYKCD